MFYCVFVWCNYVACPDGCFNGGYCSSPGMCTCPPGWTGNDCRQGMIYNLHTGVYLHYLNYRKSYCS